MRNNKIIKTFESFSKNYLIKEDNEYEEQMEKEKVDDDFIQWLALEFDLKPETIIAVTDISDNPEEVYTILNNEVDAKGYGFDKIEDNNVIQFNNFYSIRIDNRLVEELESDIDIYQLFDLLTVPFYLATESDMHSELYDFFIYLSNEVTHSEEELTKLSNFLNEYLSETDINKILNEKYIVSEVFKAQEFEELEYEYVDEFGEDLNPNENILDITLE